MYLGFRVFFFCGQVLMKFLFFSTDFRKNNLSDFMKIRPVGAELFLAEGQKLRSL